MLGLARVTSCQCRVTILHISCRCCVAQDSRVARALLPAQISPRICRAVVAHACGAGARPAISRKAEDSLFHESFKTTSVQDFYLRRAAAFSW